MLKIIRCQRLKGQDGPPPHSFHEINQVFMPKIFYIIPLLILFCFIDQESFSQANKYTDPSIIDLAGKWRFEKDPKDAGVLGKWYNNSLKDALMLPGSMAENGKGDEITLQTPWTGSIYDSSFYFSPRLAKYRQPGNVHIPFWLTPLKHYVGAAWYQKEVVIPQNWQGKHISLFLERCHWESRIWVDDREVGMNNSLVAPHEYELSRFLSPGRHRITIRIDNRIREVNVGPDSHSITDHTQGNWNGIIGKMQLKAVAPVFFRDIEVFPDIKNKKAVIRLQLENGSSRKATGIILLSAKSFNSKKSDATQVVKAAFSVNANDTSTIQVVLPFGSGMLTWDEFNPALYKLTVSLQSGGLAHKKEVQFGMREFTIRGNQFLINGRPVFLRGTLNNCEFPLTGYPDMSVEGWEKIFRKAKDYGLNHMRFHSWCPPEAAFIAGDRTGFYLQPEGPSWPNHGPKIGLGQPIDQYLYDETNRMVQQYGNYASFTMLSAGNEPAGDQVRYLNAFVDYWKKKDRRRVYTGMSVGGSWPVVPHAEFQVRGGVRGLTWNKRPETLSDFSEGISKFSVPFVAHEMGQWVAFPNFGEIKDYKGVYRAKNFELFQQDLKDRGMGDQARDFLLASGKLQVLCYKNEIEKTLRTPGYAGFQLLGLQDFPGQGTALVGVLNPFWQEKGYVTAKEFSRFCNSTVPLAGLTKFVFTNDEVFEAKISVFHSGQSGLNALISWNIKNGEGKIVRVGAFPKKQIENGNGIPAGNIRFPLSEIKQAEKMTLQVKIEGTVFSNDWDFWVYPAVLPAPSNEIYYTTDLDEKAKSVLDRGGKVFLNAAGRVVKGKEVVMHFQPVFWNTSWFKMRPPHVTGMLIQSHSSAFADFPTSFHSDLQWWEIAERSQVMILEDFPAGFRPLVQPIDTWFINRRLALVYEARVGKGKLIVSSADLRADLRADLTDRPAASQLFYSLMKYMASGNFNPKGEVSFEVVKDVFVSPSKEKVDMYTKDSPDELKPNSNQNRTEKKQ
jgi:hypothetical protein